MVIRQAESRYQMEICSPQLLFIERQTISLFLLNYLLVVLRGYFVKNTDQVSHKLVFIKSFNTLFYGVMRG